MIPPSLNLAMKHFPKHKNILESLYRQNESFRSLCEDFRDCIQAMEYWCKSPSDKEHVPELCEEYKALCTDLKREIAKWLMEQNSRA
jgi:hypothetical protein